jgi:hypothetical protein
MHSCEAIIRLGEISEAMAAMGPAPDHPAAGNVDPDQGGGPDIETLLEKGQISERENIRHRNR